MTCADNMDRVLQKVGPAQLERLAARCTKALHRGKVLRKLKCDGLLVVAVDGTELFAVSKPLGTGWLTRTLSDGTTQYYRSVLAAKVVTPIGLVLPVGFEFIENVRKTYTKQDCETKAFRRLAARIRRLFGRTSILVLADGLYAQEPVMRICEDHGWSYTITLNDGKLPTLQTQIQRARQGLPVVDGSGWPRANATCGQIEAHHSEHNLHRLVQWITPLRYHRRIVHIIELTETRDNGRYHNVWVTDLKPTDGNAMELAQTGRLRWKIENEGTNTQKTGGYEMEHAYGVRGNAWKNYYLVLQLAQLLNDLYRLGDLPAKLTGDLCSTFTAIYGTVRNLAKELRESFRRDRIRLDAGPDPGTIQIRLPDPPFLFLLGS